MYTFYEYPKCSTCRKAKAELNQLGLDVESINIKENPPSAQFLKELLVGLATYPLDLESGRIDHSY